jgi:hypothetical protein
MTLSPNDGELFTRTRPRKAPEPPITHLTALRHATYSYLVVMEITLQELAAIEGNAEVTYLEAALCLASGKLGSTFGTPHNIASLVDGLLGDLP